VTALEEHEAAALEVRPSVRKQLRPLTILVAFFTCYVLGAVTGFIDAWLAVGGVALFGVPIAIGLAQAARARRAPWELRLDHMGVTVRGHDRVPWSDVEEVRVSRLTPRWLWAPRFTPRFLRVDDDVVSFVPSPGVEVPPLPSMAGRGRWGRFHHRRRQREYDTQLVVLLMTYDTSVGELVAAVERWSNVPVR